MEEKEDSQSIKVVLLVNPDVNKALYNELVGMAPRSRGERIRILSEKGLLVENGIGMQFSFNPEATSAEETKAEVPEPVIADPVAEKRKELKKKLTVEF